METDSRMKLNFAIGLIIVILVGFVAIGYWVTSLPGSTLFNVINGVMGSAIVGSLINQSQRPDAATMKGSAWIYVLWKCAVALSFAVVLYLLFVSNIVQGSIFPSFICVDADFSGLDAFVRGVQPAKNVDVAKCLVWGFIAGYSERFVPNILERISTEAEESARVSGNEGVQ